MLNSLDLFVIVFWALAALSLLSLCLMFLIRDPRVKKISFGMVAALGIYTGYVGFRIGSLLFPAQTIIGVLAAIVGVGSIVLFAVGKNSEKRMKLAQFAASSSLLIGIANAFFF